MMLWFPVLKKANPSSRVPFAQVLSSSGNLYLWNVKINEEHPNENKLRTFNSELAIARESAIITCVWQRLKDRQREALEWKRGKASGVS